QDKYDEAGPSYECSLAILEEAPGPDHPDATASLINRGGVASEAGKYDEAEPLCELSLAILEKALGPDH
ncbi:unnamed protein product, partial [Hapterophycus canaliculatus]